LAEVKGVVLNQLRVAAAISLVKGVSDRVSLTRIDQGEAAPLKATTAESSAIDAGDIGEDFIERDQGRASTLVVYYGALPG
jgi:hypothetical protein